MINYPLYHISFNDSLPSIIDPKRNDGIYKEDPEYEEEIYPEPDTPRFSCSPTIINCFQAIYPNVKHFFDVEHYPYLLFYVYSPIINKTTVILTPDQLAKQRMVHDAHITKEHCILNKVEIVKKYQIKIKSIRNVKRLYYHPFNDLKEPKDSWVPDGFSYEILKDYSKQSISTESFKPIYSSW